MSILRNFNSLLVISVFSVIFVFGFYITGGFCAFCRSLELRQLQRLLTFCFYVELLNHFRVGLSAQEILLLVIIDF